MSSNSQYAAMLVDLDGTLYRAKPVRWAMTFELLLLGFGVIRTLRAFRKQHELVRAAEVIDAHSPYDEQLNRAAKVLGKSPAQVRVVVTGWMVERPVKWLRRFARVELLTELAAFRSAGGKLALVSDYPASHKAQAFARWVEFDVVVSNGEEHSPKRLKPDPAGYLKAAELLGIEADKCLVVGDRVDADGQAAANAGMAFRHIK